MGGEKQDKGVVRWADVVFRLEGKRGREEGGGEADLLPFSPGMVDNDEAQPLTTTETRF